MPNSYNTVTVTTAATKIISIKAQREGNLIVNASNQTVYLGMDSTVTTATGLPLLANAVFSNTGYLHAWRGDIYGIVAGTTADVRFWDYENP